jgi:hypothetical protein
MHEGSTVLDQLYGFSRLDLFYAGRMLALCCACLFSVIQGFRGENLTFRELFSPISGPNRLGLKLFFVRVVNARSPNRNSGRDVINSFAAALTFTETSTTHGVFDLFAFKTEKLKHNFGTLLTTNVRTVEHKGKVENLSDRNR